MCAYNTNEILMKITSSALGNIQMYTDEEEYEMILIDNRPKGQEHPMELDRKYNCINIHKYIEVDDIGYSASMNRGVKEASRDVTHFVFIHNDVFVWEGWLKKLRDELYDGWDAIQPGQAYIRRDQVVASYEGKEDRLGDDGGLLMLTRSTFEKLDGGWDERFRSVFHNTEFQNKIRREIPGAKIHVTNKVIITHIGGITTFTNPDFDEQRFEEGKYLTS